MMGEFRFEAEKRIRVSIRASVTTVNTSYVGVKYDDGTHDTIVIPCTHPSGDRSNETFFAPRNFPKPGEIEWATFELPDSPVTRRGQIYAMAQIVIGKTHPAFMTGYVTTPNHLGLGQFEDSLKGKGYLDWVQEENDKAGNTTSTTVLAATNARRIVRGIVVKYHSDANSATRTLTTTLRKIADGGGPTGWSIASDSWISPTISLIANQEGLLRIGEHGFVSMNDNGTLTYADNTSAPNPFPLEVEQGDPVELVVVAGSGLAGDDYDVWVLYEEWIVE